MELRVSDFGFRGLPPSDLLDHPGSLGEIGA